MQGIESISQSNSRACKIVQAQEGPDELKRIDFAGSDISLLIASGGTLGFYPLTLTSSCVGLPTTVDKVLEVFVVSTRAEKTTIPIRGLQTIPRRKASHPEVGLNRQDQSRSGRVRQNQTRAQAASFSFINLPYTKSFEPVALALICLSVCGNHQPRIVADRRSGGARVKKLVLLIEQATWMVSDMTPVGSPRLNMAIEAGIALAVCPHERLIFLDRRQYRLHQIASDLSGFDPVIYARGQEKLVVRDLLMDFAPRANPVLALRLYSTCRKNLGDRLADHQQTTLFSPHGWAATVEMVKDLWQYIQDTGA